MADKYLVKCECGADMPVSPNQAGSKVTCGCGRTISVPPLRQLRHLPRHSTQSAAPTTSWSPRHSVAVAGAVFTAGLLLWAAWLWATEPPMPRFDEQAYSEGIEQMLETGTPVQLWEVWETRYKTLGDRGFDEIPSPHKDAINDYIERRQLYRNVILGIAAVVAVVSVIAWLALPRAW